MEKIIIKDIKELIVDSSGIIIKQNKQGEIFIKNEVLLNMKKD